MQVLDCAVQLAEETKLARNFPCREVQAADGVAIAVKRTGVLGAIQGIAIADGCNGPQLLRRRRAGQQDVIQRCQQILVDGDIAL